jgi:hypothetical protein
MKSLIAIACVGASASALSTAPIDALRAEAKREENQNVQIHDYFANLEAQDSGRERQIKHDKNLMMLQTRTKTSPVDRVARQVKADFANRIHISDAFVANEQDDVRKERAIKSNRNLRAFLQTKAKASPIDKVAAAVARDTHFNIQIHDGFAAQEQKSIANEIKITKDVRAKSFLQKGKKPFDFDFSKMGTDSDEDKKPSEMDKYVAEYEKKQGKSAIDSTDFSQHVSHSYTSSGSIISIPLSSQLQKSIE